MLHIIIKSWKACTNNVKMLEEIKFKNECCSYLIDDENNWVLRNILQKVDTIICCDFTASILRYPGFVLPVFGFLSAASRYHFLFYFQNTKRKVLIACSAGKTAFTVFFLKKFVLVKAMYVKDETLKKCVVDHIYSRLIYLKIRLANHKHALVSSC